MDDCLLKGKRFVCREWTYSKLLHCVDTRAQAKTCGTLILGGPGSGKTALCCELRWPTGSSSKQTQSNIVHLSRHELRKQDLHSRLLAAHFCEAHNVDSLAVLSFVRNIREQLLQDTHFRSECTRNSSYAQKCTALFEEAMQRGDADDAFVHGIIGLLSHIAPPDRNRFILVDSLDESFLCDDMLASVAQSAALPQTKSKSKSTGGSIGSRSSRSKGRSRTIAELLSRNHSTLPIWLSLICTVRKQSRSVTRLFTGFRTITLDDTKKTHVVRDVQQFILHRVEADDGLRALLNNRDSIEMLNALHIKSNACFLYLETVLNGIQDNFVALREIKDIPGTLNGLYLWLCQRLFSKRSLFQQVQPILNAIVASRAPLSESDLFAALWSRDHRLDYAHFSARLELLGRLLVYGPPPSSSSISVSVSSAAPVRTPVRSKAAALSFDATPTDNTLLLFHHSFAEWLLDVKLCTRKYLCNVQDGHAMLAMSLTLENSQGRNRSRPSAYQVAEYVLHVCKCVLDPSATQRGTLSAASSTVLLQHAGLNLAQLGLGSGPNQSAPRKPSAINADAGTETSCSMSISMVGTPSEVTQATYAGGQLTRAHIALWFLFSSVDLALLSDLNFNVNPIANENDAESADSESAKGAIDALMERFMSALNCAADRNADSSDPPAVANDLSSTRSAAADTVDYDKQADTSRDINAIATQIQAMTASVNQSFAVTVDGPLEPPASNGNHRDSSSRSLQTRVEVDVQNSQTLPVAPISRRPSSSSRASASGKPHTGSISNVHAATPTAHSGTQAAASRLLLCAAAAQGNLQIVRAVIEAAESDPETDAKALANIRDKNGSTPLGLASRHGHIEVLEYLISKQADLDVFDNDGWSALRAAAWAGNTAVVDALLRAGAKPNATGVDRRTAIRAAAWNGHEDVLKLLLNAGADVNMPDIEGRTPLIAAAYMGHVDIIELLIDAGANINHVDNDDRSALSIACMCVSSTSHHPQIINALLEHGAEANRYDRDGMTPLLIAVYEGNRDVCEILLEWDVDIECVDRQSRTPLLAAIVMGHASIVNTLLFWGAQIDTIDNEGRSILSIAAAYGNPDVLAELLARGLDEQHRDNAGLTPLHLAAFEGHADASRLLLDNGAQPNQLDNDGRAALLLAVQEGQLDCVRTLIEYGADVDLAAHDGRTSLRCAALENNYQLVESLVREFDADIDARDADGRTCLYVLVLESRVAMVRLLLDLHADPSLPDADGRSCLHVAAWQGSLEMVDALLAAGAPPDAVDAEGRTPLQIAAWQGHEQLINSLVRAGANVDHACVQGATALSVAAQEGHVECVRVLLDAGANTQHQDQFGRTPLRVAMKNQHWEIVRLLENASGSQPSVAGNANGQPNAEAIAPPAPPSRNNLRASPLPKSIAQSQLTLFEPLGSAEAPNRYSAADFNQQAAFNSSLQNQLQNALRSSSNSSNSNSNLALAAKSQAHTLQQQQQPTSATSSNNSLQQALNASVGITRMSALPAPNSPLIGFSSPLASTPAAAAPAAVSQSSADPVSASTSAAVAHPHKRRSKRQSSNKSRTSRPQPIVIGNDADAYFERDAFNEDLDYGAALIMDGLAQFSAPLDSRAAQQTQSQNQNQSQNQSQSTQLQSIADDEAEEQPADAELSGDESDENPEAAANEASFLWNGDSSRLGKTARGKQHVVNSTSWQRGHRRDLADPEKGAKKDAAANQSKRSSGLFNFFRRKEKKRDEPIGAVNERQSSAAVLQPSASAKSAVARKQRSSEMSEQTQREQQITQELIQQQKHAILQQQANLNSSINSSSNVSSAFAGRGVPSANGLSVTQPQTTQLAAPPLAQYGSPVANPNVANALLLSQRLSVRASASSGSQPSGTPTASRPTSMVVPQSTAAVQSANGELFAIVMGQSIVANVNLGVQSGALGANVASAKRETHL